MCTKYKSVSNIGKEGIYTKYKDLWLSDVFNYSKCYNYRMFKKNPKMETYLLKLPVWSVVREKVMCVMY